MIGDYINLSDHSTAQLVARAVERAEADACSGVVMGPDGRPVVRVVGNRVHEAVIADREARAARMGRPAGQAVCPFSTQATLAEGVAASGRVRRFVRREG